MALCGTVLFSEFSWSLGTFAMACGACDRPFPPIARLRYLSWAGIACAALMAARGSLSLCIPLVDLEGPNVGLETLAALRSIGAFQARLPLSLEHQTGYCFRDFKQMLAMSEEEKRRFIVGKDLLSLHGYQPKGELGERYNAHRSGFVCHGLRPMPWLSESQDMRIAVWRKHIWHFTGRIFDALLMEIQEDVSTPAEKGFFSENGHFDMVSRSQFQVKEMHPAPQGGSRKLVRLPLHQDPSFLSLLIHGSNDPPGQGLEIWHDDSQSFVPVPRSGYGIATIIVGQLFHLLLGRGSHMRFAKGKHRVVTKVEDMEKPRLSATFFFQPSPEALLIPLVPSQSATAEVEPIISFRQRRLQSYGRFTRAEAEWKK
eukprot:s3220_g9.t2